ncbi:hypothetical protein [Falsiroseomonas sp. CW058]|uniref:hypothetical protein n=1 Tax=Falsiroseomonas sp. CW058 TaxID=3388664 RepID=UPI003D31DA7A
MLRPYIHGVSPTPPTQTSWILSSYERKDSYLASQPIRPISKGQVLREGGIIDDWTCRSGRRRPHNSKRVTLRDHRA